MVATRRQRARSSSESAAADSSAPGPPAMSRSTSMESLSNSLRRTKHRVEATVKRKKTQVKKEIKKQKAKIDKILDRDAWWTSLGYDPAVKARSVRWVERGVTCVVLALVGASQLVEAPHIPTPFSMYRFATASLLLWCGGMSLFTDTWRNPPPERGSDSHCCSSTLGPYAFFTKQALTIQTSHLIVSWVAEAFSAPRLLAVSHCFAPFAAVVAVALTLLYLKLNWFEPTWRKEVLDATNARGVDFTQITLVAHLPPLPVAVLDCLVAKRPGVFPLELRNVLGVGLLISCYCAFYTLLTLVNHRLVGRYPYPFMRALTRAWHWLAFVVALLVLADGLILPATFALLAANPT